MLLRNPVTLPGTSAPGGVSLSENAFSIYPNFSSVKRLVLKFIKLSQLVCSSPIYYVISFYAIFRLRCWRSVYLFANTFSPFLGLASTGSVGQPFCTTEAVLWIPHHGKVPACISVPAAARLCKDMQALDGQSPAASALLSRRCGCYPTASEKVQAPRNTILDGAGSSTSESGTDKKRLPRLFWAGAAFGIVGF